MMFAKGATPWFFIPLVPVAILSMLAYLARAGPVLAVALILLFLGFFMFLEVLMFVFFRDPERPIGKGIVSAADGVVKRVVDNKGTGRIAVQVFMNVHNVHVNRAPFRGEIGRVRHRPGAHIPAYDKDSDKNERTVINIGTSIGEIKVTLIAGTIARRTVAWVRPGDNVKKGDRIGMIKFSSRVDVEMDASKVRVVVEPGEKVLAGITKLAEVR